MIWFEILAYCSIAFGYMAEAWVRTGVRKIMTLNTMLGLVWPIALCLLFGVWISDQMN